jgi:hypothetical protein
MSESVSERMIRILHAGPNPEDLKRRASSLVQRAKALSEGVEVGDLDKASEELGTLVLLTRHLAKALGHDELYRALAQATKLV